MPTYEYRCSKCGKVLEVLQKITDQPARDCPDCGGKDTLKRGVGGGIGLSFTGSGYYITDYASPPKGKTDAPSSPEKKDAPSTGQTSKTCCPCGKNKCGS